MPQQIEVPGQGVVEFPDDMNDDQIRSVIKRKFYEEPLTTSVNLATQAVGTLTQTLTNPAAGEAAEEGRLQSALAQAATEQPPQSGLERAARDYQLAPGNVSGQSRVMGLTDPFIAIPKMDAKNSVLQDTLTQEFGRPPTENEAAAAAAVINQVKGYAEFAESPLGLLTMGTGVLGKLAQKLIAVGFAGSMAKSVPQAAREAGAASVTGTPQERYEAYLNLGQNVVLPGVLGRAAVPDRIRNAAPATAKALEEATPASAPAAPAKPLHGMTGEEIAKSLGLIRKAWDPSIPVIGGMQSFTDPKTGLTIEGIKPDATLEQVQARMQEKLQEGKGPENAIQPESSQVLRAMQTQPEQGAGQVPVQESGGEAGARGGQAQESLAQAAKGVGMSLYDSMLKRLQAGTYPEPFRTEVGDAVRQAWNEGRIVTADDLKKVVTSFVEPSKTTIKDRARYDQLVDQMRTQPTPEAWAEMEQIKNRYEGRPPPRPETITQAAYKDEEGFVYRGANHPQILDSLGIKGFETRESRNTEQFGFGTNRRQFVTRDEAAKIATASGQNLEQFDPGEKVHSDQVASPEQPSKPLGDVPQPVTATPPGAQPEPQPEPQLQGMGGAVGGEFIEPRQAAVAGATVEEAPPENRPLGVLSNFGSAIRNGIGSLMTYAKAAAGDTMPKTTAAHRETGEAGARYLSSRIAANPSADSFVARVLQDTEVDPVKFGAALTEDNLQSIRQSLKEQAEQERSKGNTEAADDLDAKANNVATIVGSKGSPFKTADELLDYLSDPMVKKALNQHIQLWQEVIEPQYKQARELDPDQELASRGLNTGARINLKAVTGEEEEAVGKAVTGSSGLTGTFKRRTPFSIRAKGTGNTYDINYQNIIRNTFSKQLEIANKNVFDKALVKSGNAVIDAPGKTVSLGGEGTVSFPLSRKVIVGENFTGSVARNIYVRKSLAGEYKAASGVTERARIPVVTPLFNVLNRFALAGLTDGTVHVSNQLTALFDRPASGSLMRDTLLSATGRADIPVTVIRTVMKAFQDNRQQMAELAEIGALRSERPSSGPMGRVLARTDILTRLMLDDIYKGLVEQGVADNTETARREYVNQIGQYNRRAQGWLMRTLRDTGLGPFATAGRTFNALGVKMATLSPGVPATSPMAAMALRANVLSKFVGTAVVIGTLNYLLTRNKGGGLMGRPGTKLGDVDLGINDKQGKMLALPVASIIGVGRGLRVTGARSAIDAKRMGLSDADALDSASRDIINSWAGPAAGPPVRFGAIAVTGYPAAIRVGRASAVVPPGSSQTAENVKEALYQSSPVFGTYNMIRKGEPLQQILATQLPRLVPAGGKTEPLARDYPRIVKSAQANEFINYVVHETRRQAPDDRINYATEQIKRLPPEFQKRAWDELKHRKVFAQ